MLKIIVSGAELFDEETKTFEYVGDFELELEHSLLSLSKWESKYQRPFLTNDDKTSEEVRGYVEAMCISPIFPPGVFYRLSQENLDQIGEYVQSKQSATTFGRMPDRKGRGEIITSELIYYWMVAFNIPFECETWHLNRLFALVRICNIKNSKPKKMSRHELAARNREINTERRERLQTTG